MLFRSPSLIVLPVVDGAGARSVGAGGRPRSLGGAPMSRGGGALMSRGGGGGCAMSGGGLGGHSITDEDWACATAAQPSTQPMKSARGTIVIFASCSHKINRG